MEIIRKAQLFEQQKMSFQNMSERIQASRQVKTLILDLNEIYKMGHDPRIMDLMKRLTVLKKKIEKRLKGRQ